MRIVFDDIKESLAPNFKGGEKSFASRALSMTATATLCLLQLCQLSRFLQLCICEIVGQNGFVV